MSTEHIDQPTVTTFDEIEQRFLGTVTDDMYLAITEWETEEMLDELLIQALPWFRFPRNANIFKYSLENRSFAGELDEIEKQIIVKYMTMIWVQQQIYNIDVIRQKYTSGDFKLTSQASHLKQLIVLKQETEREGNHLQMDYDRRKYDAETGMYKTNMSTIMEVY